LLNAIVHFVCPWRMQALSDKLTAGLVGFLSGREQVG